MQRDQMMQQQNIQAQAQLEVQKQQALKQAEAQLEQMKAQMDAQKMQADAALKSRLMEQEFQYNMQLRAIDSANLKSRENNKENRKDERTKIQASQQSELIEQRKSGAPPKNFESAGNDILGGGFNLGAFEPK